MIDNKGLTDEEIQDLINWKIQCREFDKMMWMQNAKDIIKRIMEENKNDK